MKGYKWHTRTEEIICRKCKKKFIVYISCKRKYCSNKCAHSNRKPHSRKTKIRMSLIQKGYHNSPGTQFKKNHRPFNGIENTQFKKGNRPTNWKGGVSKARQKIYRTKKWRLWKKQLYDRSEGRCEECNKKCRFHIHHIKSWAKYPELRLDINNCIVLCPKCHAKKHPEINNLIDR